MAVNKVVGSMEEAIADIKDGATIMFGGFAGVGVPTGLVQAVKKKGIKNLTVICNDAVGAWTLPIDVSMLVESGQIKKIIGSFMSYASPKKITEVERRVTEGLMELELVPQGTLAERIRIAGAGIGGFYTATGVGTIAEKGKDKRVIDGREMILETALHADFACIHAQKGDNYGNLVYHGSARTYNPIMAAAAKITIAEVDEIVKVGDLNPDFIHTPSVYVTRVVKSAGKAGAVLQEVYK